MNVRSEFIEALRANEPSFGLDLEEAVIGRLTDHFELVMEHNPLLHLVGPASAREFAVRHVLESLTMLEFLPEGARFADVGTGAGFPAIPCLIARDDLIGLLIESKEKKAEFLKVAVDRLGIGDRTVVINRQYSETPHPDVSYVSCRALDRFTQHIPKLLKWTGNGTLLFFGGPALREEMQRLGLSVEEKLMPLSEQRYLFVARRAA